MALERGNADLSEKVALTEPEIPVIGIDAYGPLVLLVVENSANPIFAEIMVLSQLLDAAACLQCFKDFPIPQLGPTQLCLPYSSSKQRVGLPSNAFPSGPCNGRSSRPGRTPQMFSGWGSYLWGEALAEDGKIIARWGSLSCQAASYSGRF